MSNQVEEEESPFQPLPPLPQRPEWGILLPESSPPDSIDRPFSFPTSYVRDGSPVAHDRSPASGPDALNLVVSDRAGPDHGRSASGRSLYGPLRAGSPFRGRPPNPHYPYDMKKYHAINETARTSYPVNSDNTMNNDPASNPPPYNSGFVSGVRGSGPPYFLHPQNFEWNPAFMTDETHPYSIIIQRQLIASPSLTPAIASAAVPAPPMIAAPVLAPSTARAAPVTRSTRARAREQPASVTNFQVTRSTRSRARKNPTLTANIQTTSSTRSTRSGAKKQPTLAADSRRQKTPASAATPAQEEEEQNIPWHDRREYGIDRRSMKELELAQVRPGYGTLIPRKDCFKNAPPGAKKPVECSITESELVWTLRGARGDKQHRLRATAILKARLDKQREEGRLAGYPATMAIENRFPIMAPTSAVIPAAASVIAPGVAPAVAPTVAGNAAESTENQEIADDD